MEQHFDKSFDAEAYDRELRTWAMALHLSVLAGYAAPILGFLAPILIWQIKKEEFPELDAHGRVVANWIFSLIIYGVIASFLLIIFIGIFMWMILGVLALLFPIIGGLKASNGEVWRYPLSFPIF